MIYINKIIDCLGEICPVPVIKAKIQYNTLKIGESLTILSDHSCTVNEMKETFRKYSCVVSVEEVCGIWKINIIKLG